MASLPQTRMSVDEYIRRYIMSNEKPACEYVDGVLIPKSMGTNGHATVQSNLAYLIRAHYGRQFRALTELSVHNQKIRFRIPDVSVIDRARPIKGHYPGPDNPCFLCIEIKSPDDTVEQLSSKCREEYHPWGVAYCWIINPETLRAWEYFAADHAPREIFAELTAEPIMLELADVFYDVSP